MTGLLLATIAVLGITGVVIEQKGVVKWMDFLNLLFFSATILLLIYWEGELLSNDGKSIGFGLISIVMFSFLISKVAVFRKKIVRSIFPVVGISLLFFFFQEQRLNDAGFEFGVTDTLIVVGALFAAIAYELACLKASILSKWFNFDYNEVVKLVLLILLGVIVFMELFAGSHFGLLIATTAFLSSSFFFEKDGKPIVYSFLIVALSGLFLREAAFENVELVLGKVLEGLFIGSASVYMLNVFSKAKKNVIVSLLLGHVLVFILLFGLFWLGTIYTGLGGADAFLGGAIGFAIANAIVTKQTESTALFSFLLIGGLTFPSMFENEELKAFQAEIMESSIEEVEEKEVVLPLADLNGTYEFVKESSSISFQLGPKGAVTQGAIRNFEGEINVPENVLETSISVTMPVLNLTTFIAMRDEEVHGENYLNADKFPEMTFVSESLNEVSGSENTYTANGMFTMLGVSKEQTVELKLIEEGDKLWLIGSGKVDRREFGMTPDDKEGNIVDFTFKVELSQK